MEKTVDGSDENHTDRACGLRTIFHRHTLSPLSSAPRTASCPQRRSVTTSTSRGRRSVTTAPRRRTSRTTNRWTISETLSIVHTYVFPFQSPFLTRHRDC
ncbi:hypothetical protein CEXT_752921 [Caerostris extrusa]|uniref:Uncharacterized protein n=1 Tax=Caerostris extrusa TaxID=172846 RepID=A0AAV4M8Z3_CAEEX|nr:hypothetical protein CEXT_752921 [Caerostris extrusa]